MWNDPNTQLNGRQGHSQQGVDIFGLPYYADNFYGVQCKGRNANYNSRLTQKDVIAECNEANDKFNPGLEALVVATTSARDPKIQEQCRNLTKNHTYPFKVSVWSWDDIEEEIQYRSELMEKYYPNVKPEQMPDSLIMDYTSIDDKIYAFFTRPNIQKAISYDYRHFLYQVVSELADNVFSKGKATHVKISFNDSSLVTEDDGIEFNPLQLIEKGGRGGAFTFKKKLVNLETR